MIDLLRVFHAQRLPYASSLEALAVREKNREDESVVYTFSLWVD